MRVIDATTGATTIELDGLSMDDVERWTSSREHGYPIPWTEYGVGLIEDEGLVSIELPGAEPGGELDLFGTDDGLFAYQMTGDRSVLMWTSGDGRSWVGPERLGEDPDEPVEVDDVSIRHGEVIAQRWNNRGADRWSSRDGTTWVRAPRFTGGGPARFRLDDGWFGGRLSRKDASLYYQPDRTEKARRVGLDELGIPLGVRRTGFAAIGPRTIVHSSRPKRGGRIEHLIITFERLPG